MINRAWVIIILATGLSAINGYLFITFAYFPKLAHSKNVDQTLVGVFLSVDSVPFMVFSLAAPYLMRKFGRKL